MRLFDWPVVDLRTNQTAPHMYASVRSTNRLGLDLTVRRGSGLLLFVLLHSPHHMTLVGTAPDD